MVSSDEEANRKCGQSGGVKSPRKASRRETTGPVLQTDTGGLVENTKAIGETVAKEFGKSAGRNFGRCPACLVQRARWAAAKER